MIMSILSIVLVSLFVLCMGACCGYGWIALWVSLDRKIKEKKRDKLERRYLCSFEEWCVAYADELSESEVTE